MCEDLGGHGLPNPPAAVFRLLYQVVWSRQFRVRENVEPIIANQATQVYAHRNTIKLSENQKVSTNKIRQLVSAQPAELFGLEVVDLTAAKIEYSHDLRGQCRGGGRG